MAGQLGSLQANGFVGALRDRLDPFSDGALQNQLQAALVAPRGALVPAAQFVALTFELGSITDIGMAVRVHACGSKSFRDTAWPSAAHGGVSGKCSLAPHSLLPHVR